MRARIHLSVIRISQAITKIYALFSGNPEVPAFVVS